MRCDYLSGEAMHNCMNNINGTPTLGTDFYLMSLVPLVVIGVILLLLVGKEEK